MTVVFAPCTNHKGQDKDTLANVKAMKECVFHIMSDWYVEAANHTCGAFPPSADEFELSGLTPVDSEMVTPPRIGEVSFQEINIIKHNHITTAFLVGCGSA
jgi:flavin reductase (DIM6/NTAB) family NADH-FMN oxidoreductase RutF